MSKEENPLLPKIDCEHLQDYLQNRWYPDAKVTGIHPLGQSTQEGLKDYGYGRPLQITFDTNGEQKSLVLRTMSPDPFGHERRADRADVLLQAYDTFHSIPQHIKPLDVGAFDDKGNLIPMARGEFYLITEYVDGELYAHDLYRLSQKDELQAVDIARAKYLARYLATLHGETQPPDYYKRELRDIVGSGEGIFGLCDSYPRNHPYITPLRLQAIEMAAVRWRWKLKAKSHRIHRTHGDFHPFNLLFRDHCDMSVLDCSRGGLGDPADDLAALTINYIFFSLQKHRLFHGALREVWNIFWHTYLEETGDTEVLEVIAPYFTWRGLVVASPVWYPNIEDSVRNRIICFIERLLDGEAFHPDKIDDLL